MAISTSTRWEDIAAAKRAALMQTIPPEWVIPDDILPPPKQLDVTSFPLSSGWFTTLELEITSSTSSEILSRVQAGIWSARDVTSAFCKRASAAHQLVSGFCVCQNAICTRLTTWTDELLERDHVPRGFGSCRSPRRRFH